MRLVLLQNKNAGRGAGRPVTGRILSALRGARHEVAVFDFGAGVDDSGVPGALAGADAMLVAGGDGTLHHSVHHAIGAGVPVYHVPLGTENLFARQFRMDTRPETLLRALEARRVAEVDVGDCNGHRFLLMCSVGFDACVVQRVAAARTAGVTRVAYLLHGARELAAPRFSPLTVEVDGATVVRERSGLVVVANSRQYAARLDPIPHASMSDGLLDVLFLPFGSRVRLAWWAIATVARRHLASDRAIQAKGSRVAITASGAAVPYQLDGECGLRRSGAAEGVKSLLLGVKPGALRVLTPA